MATPGPGDRAGRPLTIAAPGDGPALDAVLEIPGSGEVPVPCIVICHPHPLYGGDRHSNVVRALAEGALAVGVAALSFDFRGVGASEGSHDGGRGERDDARAALAAAAAAPEVDASRIGLAGYSFGGGVASAVVADALAGGDAGPEALALVATSMPPPDDIGPALVGYAGPLLLASGTHDRFCSADALAAVASARGERGAETETLIVPGIDHFWLGGERRLTEQASAFFRKAFGREQQAR